MSNKRRKIDLDLACYYHIRGPLCDVFEEIKPQLGVSVHTIISNSLNAMGPVLSCGEAAPEISVDLDALIIYKKKKRGR